MLDPDGEGLDQGRQLEIRTRRNLEHQALVEQHVLSVAAGTLRVVADDAEAARRPDSGDRRDERADREWALAAGSVVEDLCDVLVAHHDGLREIDAAVGAAGRAVALDDRLARLEEVRVRCAERASMGAHEHLALDGHRVGKLAHLHPTVLENRRSHRARPLFVLLLSRSYRSPTLQA